MAENDGCNRPRLVINLPMDVTTLSRILRACPPGAYTRPAGDERTMPVYWDDEAERAIEQEEADENASPNSSTGRHPHHPEGYGSRS